MDNNVNELLVLRGPLSGSRFAITESGIRLGRSSSCEIAIPDPSLSRNQCLFEIRNGEVFVIDLASANGTEVNGESLGSSSLLLRMGDRITAGESELVLVAAGDGWPQDGDGQEPVDLGFDRPEEPAADDEAKPAGGSPLRLILWLLLVLVLGGSAAAILLMPAGGESGSVFAKPLAPAKLWSVYCEKVEASTKGICRYAIEIDDAGRIVAELDDVPDNDRHISKTA